MTCGCPRDGLCDRCVDDVFAQLRGVAACRGEVWAMNLARRCRRDLPWPAFEGRTRELARAKISDLTGDPRLAERLARELASWAARWWTAPARLVA